MKERSDTERTKRKKRSIFFAGALGAALAYFLDPDRGRGRRAKAKDRMSAAVRRFGRRGGRLARRAESEAYGALQRATHPSTDNPPIDDQTLKQKVETELFGKRDVEKGKIVVNVEDGVVVLRGEVGSPEQMTELSELALLIPGVAGVQNLLHLPEEPSPNKAAARKASARATETP